MKYIIFLLPFLSSCGNNNPAVTRCAPVTRGFEYSCQMDGQKYRIQYVYGEVDLERLSNDSR